MNPEALFPSLGKLPMTCRQTACHPPGTRFLEDGAGQEDTAPGNFLGWIGSVSCSSHQVMASTSMVGQSGMNSSAVG